MVEPPRAAKRRGQTEAREASADQAGASEPVFAALPRTGSRGMGDAHGGN